MGRVVAGRPGHAAARVGTRAAQVQAPDRGGVPGPARHRPHVEQLAGRDVAVEDVALGQPVVALQVQRGEHLPGQHRRGHTRRELRDPGQDPVAELVPPAVPGPLGQPVGHVLDEARHDVPAFGGQRGVHGGGHHAVHEQLLRVGQLAALGPVVARVGHGQVRRQGEQRPLAGRGVRGHAPHLGLGVQDQVDLGARAVHRDPGHRGPEVRGQIGLVHQVQEGPLGVGAGQHHAGGQFLAAGQRDPVGAAAGDPDPGHRRPGADLHPVRLPGRGDGVADRAHAAHHVPEEARHRVLAAGEQVEGQADQGARLVGAAVLAVQVVGQQQRLGRPGLEPRVDELAEAAGQHLGQALDVGAAQAAQVTAHPHRLGEPAQPGGPGVRRQLHEQRLQPGGQLGQLGVHAGEGARVRRGVPRDPGRRARRVVPVGQHLPVVQRHLQGRLAGHHPQPVPAQVQRPDHLRPEHARDVGGGGGPAAGRDLLGDAASAGHLAGLDHQRGQARAGQQGAGGQAVVTGPDHDDVPARRGGHEDGLSLLTIGHLRSWIPRKYG